MTKEIYFKILEHLKTLIQGTEFEGCTYAVGGCVRDELMGCDNIKDIDLVINLPQGGIKLAQWLEKNGHIAGTIVVYETYGTAMFRLAAFPDEEIECVQTRKEQYHDKQSRNPETAYGTLIEDCMRRDLTINALYRNISTGSIDDPCGHGTEDMRHKLLRVTSTPDIVYEDDPLRILRAIRFYCRLGKEWYIDVPTYNGMLSHASRLEIITAERKQDELNKILMSANPVEGLKMIRSIGAMKYLIPELEETYDMTQNDYHFGTVWEHTLKVVEETADVPVELNPDDMLVLRVAALLHDIGKIRTRTVGEDGRVHFYKHELKGIRMVDTILRRLKYSNDFIKDVQFLTENHMLTKPWKDNLDGFKNENNLFRAMRKLQYKCVPESAGRENRRRFNLLLNLIHADNMSHADAHCLPNQVRNILMVSERMEFEETDMFGFRMPADGDDVMRVKERKPGPDVRKYLDYMMKQCFVNPRITKEELLKKIANLKADKI